MALMLNDEQRMLRDSAADYLAQRAPVAALRRLRDELDPIGYDLEVWREVAELGWPAAVFPESEGGLGLGWKGLGAVAECAGRHLSAMPMTSSVVLCGSLLLEAASAEQRQRWLPGVMDGSLRLALALEETPRHAPQTMTTRAQANRHADGQAWVLDGHKQFVLDGMGAGQFVVAARCGSGPGISLFMVSATAPGLSVAPIRLVDGRVVCQLSLQAVRVQDQDRIGVVDSGAKPLEAALDRARILLAAEGLGLLRAAFDMTVDYLKQRVQFDVPIGSFQALQHRAARLFAELELLESCVDAALDALDLDDAEVPLLASLAKARMSDLSERLLNEAVQMHGGIGVTDEFDLGLYLKRGRVLQQSLGDGVFHRNRYAQLKGF